MLEKISNICVALISGCYFILGALAYLNNNAKWKLALVSILYGLCNLLLFLGKK